MWNGAAVAARVLSLAIFLVSMSGCDIGVAPPQAAKTATEPPRSQPLELRSQADAARKRVWFLSRDGVFLHDVGTSRKVAVPLPDWMWVGTDYSCLPDLALGPNGEAVITSNILPTLWRIDPETLAVSVHPLVLDADADKDVGFSGLVYSSLHKAFFAVSDLHGSLWRIDPLLRTASKITLSAPIPKACGLTVQPRASQRKTLRPGGLCARAPGAEWAIDLAADQRSAYVRAASCTDRLAAQLDALLINEE